MEATITLQGKEYTLSDSVILNPEGIKPGRGVLTWALVNDSKALALIVAPEEVNNWNLLADKGVLKDYEVSDSQREKWFEDETLVWKTIRDYLTTSYVEYTNEIELSRLGTDPKWYNTAGLHLYLITYPFS